MDNVCFMAKFSAKLIAKSNAPHAAAIPGHLVSSFSTGNRDLCVDPAVGCSSVIVVDVVVSVWILLKISGLWVVLFIP